MKITFDVKNQIITRTDRNQVISNSGDYLEAEISFSADWTGLEKTMTFKNGDELYTIVLANDKILQENHLNLGVGTWKASIIGIAGDQKIVTNECNVSVNSSGWIGSESIPPESVWNQLLVIIQSLHTEAASTAVVRSAVQKYIEDNYDSLVKEYIIIGNVREIIEELVQDGTISDLIAPFVTQELPGVVTTQLPGVVTSQLPAVVTSQLPSVVSSQLPAVAASAAAAEVGTWLTAHVDPDTGYVIDNTLTVSLAAADAKTVGDKVTAIKSALSHDIDNLKITYSYQYCDYDNKEDNTRYYKVSESQVGTSEVANSFVYPPFKVKAGTYYFKNVVNTVSYAKTNTGVFSFKTIMGSEVTEGTIVLVKDCEIYISGSTTLGSSVFADSSVFPRTLTFGSYDLKYNGIDVIKDNHEIDGINVIPIASSPYTNGTLTITPTDGSYVFGNGTPSANGYYVLYNGTLPDGCYVGEKYIVTEFGFVHGGWSLEIHAYVSGDWVLLTNNIKNVIITIPSGATALRVRIAISKDIPWNGEILTIKAYSVKSNNYVDTMMKWNYPVEVEKPIITIIDDDGHPRFAEYVVPIIQAKKVPIASAVITGWVGSASEMTWEQIEDAYVKGAEILSHSNSHYDSDVWLAMPLHEIAYDYRISMYKLRNHGIKCNGLVYTGASGNYNKIINANKQVSDYGFRAGTNHTNYKGADRYTLDRWNLHATSTLKDFTDLIDALVTDGTGWQVWMIHTSSDEFDATAASILTQAIEYALQNNIQIVTTDYGVSRYCE